jgi:hypothetical protein
MNVEIGTEAALFPEKEYINEIFLAVWVCGEVCSVQGCMEQVFLVQRYIAAYSV